MLQHTDWKYKRGQIAIKEQKKQSHMEELARNGCSNSVREKFHRPAYGKIGERRD